MKVSQEPQGWCSDQSAVEQPAQIRPCMLATCVGVCSWPVAAEEVHPVKGGASERPYANLGASTGVGTPLGKDSGVVRVIAACILDTQTCRPEFRDGALDLVSGLEGQTHYKLGTSAAAGSVAACRDTRTY